MTHADEMNARALAEGLRQLREEVAFQERARQQMGQRLVLLETQVAMQGKEIAQLQTLFATRTVERDSGPTT